MIEYIFKVLHIQSRIEYKFNVLSYFTCLCITFSVGEMNAQNVNILGGVKVSVMDTATDGRNVVVRDTTGALAEMDLNLAFFRFIINLPNGYDLLDIAGATVDNLLQNGYTPLDLYRAGFPLDSLWGRYYQGGLVFYLDTLNLHPFDGLVCYPWPEGPWNTFYGSYGCAGTDLPIPNASTMLPDEPGAAIGEGSINTIGIDTASCSQTGNAAVDCASLDENGYSDWFLPSFLELVEIRNNLHLNGFGYFLNTPHWSSSEASANSAWLHPIIVNGISLSGKGGGFYYRPIRAF